MSPKSPFGDLSFQHISTFATYWVNLGIQHRGCLSHLRLRFGPKPGHAGGTSQWIYWFGTKPLKPSNDSPKPSRSPFERISFRASYSMSRLLMWISICFKDLSIYGLEAEDHIKCLLAAMLNQSLQCLQFMVTKLKNHLILSISSCNRQASEYMILPSGRTQSYSMMGVEASTLPLWDQLDRTFQSAHSESHEACKPFAEHSPCTWWSGPCNPPENWERCSNISWIEKSKVRSPIWISLVWFFSHLRSLLVCLLLVTIRLGCCACKVPFLHGFKPLEGTLRNCNTCILAWAGLARSIVKEWNITISY